MVGCVVAGTVQADRDLDPDPRIRREPRPRPLPERAGDRREHDVVDRDPLVDRLPGVVAFGQRQRAERDRATGPGRGGQRGDARLAAELPPHHAGSARSEVPAPDGRRRSPPSRSPRPERTSSRALGGAAGAQAAGSCGPSSSRRSHSRVAAMRTQLVPSASAWWTRQTSAIRPPVNCGTTARCHSGCARSKRSVSSWPTVRSSPGTSSWRSAATSSMWRPRSKSASSAHTGAANRSGVGRIRRRKPGNQMEPGGHAGTYLREARQFGARGGRQEHHLRRVPADMTPAQPEDLSVLPAQPVEDRPRHRANLDG